MIDRLLNNLQIFTDRLDQGRSCTEEIFKAVRNENWERVAFSTSNREKILEIIALEQEKIEKVINNIFSEELTPENINIIKSWAFDTQNWINNTALRDEEILEALNQSKDDVTQEIATVFKSKAAFRGYNLNDVRK
ncbi:MAG: hypothetical protein K9K67_02655 [Bacteriovoracaceae bacterium]|nr:hypothetical protein [Bacteriovoracaceae bacterium]